MPRPRREIDVVDAVKTAEWQALKVHYERFHTLDLRQLFAHDPLRFEHFSLQACDLLLDYSKNLLTREIRQLLLSLAQKCGLAQAIEAMFEGAVINNTEQRPALHVALRSPAGNSEAEQAVQQTLRRMEGFVSQVVEGEWLGYSGQAITDIVNIGIGGSDLGPAMAYQALAPYHIPGISCHFVSNVDPAHLTETLLGLTPETTLFVVASKSFTTLETAQNANAARAWVLDAAMDEAQLGRHFVAVSANIDKARAFGIDEANIFPMWDWVGGRYSLWSAIGLPIALGVGMEHFRELLSGAHRMDEHFRSAPFAQNMPVIMGMLAIWYLNFCEAETEVVLPYEQNLHLLPAFLQQLDMESLGKAVRRDGQAVELSTGGIVWGSAGTNGQHSFHQLIHQGTHLIPADFIACARSHYTGQEQHQHLLANCFAQSQALLQGKRLEEAQAELRKAGLDEDSVQALAPHKVITGNKPSNTIVMPQLTPAALGSLIAAYEHKVFVQSVIWGINAFDQWGVELGKLLSADVFQALTASGPSTTFDASTNNLINYCRHNA